MEVKYFRSDYFKIQDDFSGFGIKSVLSSATALGECFLGLGRPVETQVSRLLSTTPHHHPSVYDALHSRCSIMAGMVDSVKWA